MEDKKLEQLSNLKKVSAPADFLKQFHARLEKKPIWHKLFFPLHIKLPLELAGSIATIIILISIYNFNQPGDFKTTLKASPVKNAKMSQASGRSMAKIAEFDQNKEDESFYQKPVELVLVIKEIPAAAVWVKSTVAEISPNAPTLLEHKKASAEAEIADIIRLNKGKVITYLDNQYIIEIPAKNQSNLQKDLKQFGQIKGASTIEAETQGTALIYLTIEK